MAVRTAQFFSDTPTHLDPQEMFVHLPWVVKEAVRGDRLPVEVFRLPHELQRRRTGLTPVCDANGMPPRIERYPARADCTSIDCYFCTTE